MASPHKWSPISYKSSAGQRKHIGQRPMLYRWTTQPGVLRSNMAPTNLWACTFPQYFAGHPSNCIDKQRKMKQRGSCIEQGLTLVNPPLDIEALVYYLAFSFFSVVLIRNSASCTLSAQVWSGFLFCWTKIILSVVSVGQTCQWSNGGAAIYWARRAVAR